MEAIVDKYGYKEGLTTYNSMITNWVYDVPQPTFREVRAIIKEYKEKTAYKEKRRKDYPPIVDQLDMIYKDKINSTELWRNLITSIKVKYPKPIIK